MLPAAGAARRAHRVHLLQRRAATPRSCFVRCHAGGTGDAVAPSARFAASLKTTSSPVPVQELAAELGAMGGALAAAQERFGALLARFGETADEGDTWRELAEFAAGFTAAQRQVQTRCGLAVLHMVARSGGEHMRLAGAGSLHSLGAGDPARALGLPCLLLHGRHLHWSEGRRRRITCATGAGAHAAAGPAGVRRQVRRPPRRRVARRPPPGLSGLRGPTWGHHLRRCAQRPRRWLSWPRAQDRAGRR